MKKLIIISLILVISACQEEKPKEWAYQKTVKLDGVNPIGIAVADGKLWLSDGDHNRLVQIDDGGNITKTIDSLNRPMHIDALGETLFIPQYGNDKVETFDKRDVLNYSSKTLWMHQLE